MTTKERRKKEEETKDREYLITYTRHLEKRLRNFETEKQLLEAERIRLKQELHSLRNEIDRLREPPLVGAIVIKEDSSKYGRFIVQSSRRGFYVVNASRKALNQGISPGTYVVLNIRTYTIVDVLPLEKDELTEAMEKVKLLKNKNHSPKENGY